MLAKYERAYRISIPREKNVPMQERDVRKKYLFHFCLIFLTFPFLGGWACSTPQVSWDPPTSCKRADNNYKKLSYENPSAIVSYKEPVTTISGVPLKNLLRTIIFYDKGDGAIQVMDDQNRNPVKATAPTGGREIRIENLIVPMEKDEGEMKVFFCVQAENDAGRGPIAP